MTERVEKLRQNDHRIQDTVYGFVRECQTQILNDNRYSELDTLPDNINHVIIKYYYSKQLSYNHLLLASEIFYLKELQCIKQYIFIPIKENISSLTDEAINPDDINIAFKHWNHFLTFHDQFLTAITQEKHILPTMFRYINFTKIYIEYSKEYEQMLRIFSSWTSTEFKKFLVKQLENETLTKIIENNLCSLPWYLYRPFDRIKEYRRFVKDLQLIAQTQDDDYELINKTKNHLTHTYKQIKKGIDINLSFSSSYYNICCIDTYIYIRSNRVNHDEA